MALARAGLGAEALKTLPADPKVDVYASAATAFVKRVADPKAEVSEFLAFSEHWCGEHFVGMKPHAGPMRTWWHWVRCVEVSLICQEIRN